MGELLRIKARWQGFQGAPGYSVFHMRDFTTEDEQAQHALDGAEKVRTFFESSKAWLAYGVNVQVSGEVELIEDTTGQLLDVIAVAQPGIVTSTTSVTDRYAAAVGAVVTWRTAVVRNGRRIKGRTFLVPLAGNAYDNNGTLHGDALGALNSAANSLVNDAGSPRMGVYARPTTSVAADGLWAFANSHSIPDMSAVLRSRRD